MLNLSRKMLRRVACDLRDIEPVADPCEVVGGALGGGAAPAASGRRSGR